MIDIITPIVIGVTGHRDLRDRDIPTLRTQVRTQLFKLQSEYPNSPLIMLSSIASGADTLCAESALALGIDLACPLPMPPEEYRKDFSDTDASVFDGLVKRANNVFVAPNAEPAPNERIRDFHYRQAGIYIASHSHVLLAMWDGSPAKPNGCGTAEVVDFMLGGNYQRDQNSASANGGAVIHITTPRKSSGKELPIAVRLIENYPGALQDCLGKIEASNTEDAR